MSTPTKPSVLYISYDGMLEPIGRSQVIAYLRGLADTFDFHLISFEKSEDLADPDRLRQMETELREAGITWHRLTYWRGGRFVAWNVMRGVLTALRLTFRRKIRIIHCRGYVPTLIGFLPRVLLRRKLVFDMRGFWGDERLAIGKWTPDHFMYRTIKRLERYFLLHADHTISLTRNGLGAIRAFPYMEGKDFPASVIPTCTDLDHFRSVGEREILSDGTELVVGYVGNTSNSYLLSPLRTALAALIAQLKPSGTRVRLLVVSHADREDFTPHLPDGLSAVDFHESTYDEMPGWISRMDIVAFFLDPTFAKTGSVPTKLGEILGCGRPILTNGGYGDIEQSLGPMRVGALAEDFSAAAIGAAVQEALQLLEDPELSARCREQAVAEFSLEDGTRKLAEIYESLQ